LTWKILLANNLQIQCRNFAPGVVCLVARATNFCLHSVFLVFMLGIFQHCIFSFLNPLFIFSGNYACQKLPETVQSSHFYQTRNEKIYLIEVWVGIVLLNGLDICNYFIVNLVVVYKKAEINSI